MKKHREMVNCYVSFSYLNVTVVMRTNFQHKRMHKITWLSPDQNTASQIDHIIINANKKRVIEETLI
jgi:hypothetical protein